MKYIKNVKMQVTPEQTREIQKIVFENGGTWRCNETKYNNWIIITAGGNIEWSTSETVKCYSECIAQDWLDDYYSKVPKIVTPKQSKYNFKFLEENKVALQIPTYELAKDFLIELAEYKKFELTDGYDYELTYYNAGHEYFVLYKKTYYDSYIKDSFDIADFKNISWANFTSRKNPEEYLETIEIKDSIVSIPEGTIVLAKRNDGYQAQGKYFGVCNGKHIVNFNGTSAMLYDSVEVIPTLTKKEAKQKVSELFSNPKNVSSDKIRNIIDLIKE